MQTNSFGSDIVRAQMTMGAEGYRHHASADKGDLHHRRHVGLGHVVRIRNAEHSLRF
jgi:hypothetical protein